MPDPLAELAVLVVHVKQQYARLASTEQPSVSELQSTLRWIDWVLTQLRALADQDSETFHLVVKTRGLRAHLVAVLASTSPEQVADGTLEPLGGTEARRAVEALDTPSSSSRVVRAMEIPGAGCPRRRPRLVQTHTCNQYCLLDEHCDVVVYTDDKPREGVLRFRVGQHFATAHHVRVLRVRPLTDQPILLAHASRTRSANDQRSWLVWLRKKDIKQPTRMKVSIMIEPETDARIRAA